MITNELVPLFLVSSIQTVISLHCKSLQKAILTTENTAVNLGGVPFPCKVGYLHTHTVFAKEAYIQNHGTSAKFTHFTLDFFRLQQ